MTINPFLKPSLHFHIVDLYWGLQRLTQKNTTIIQGPERLAISILIIRERNVKNSFLRVSARIWDSIPICLRSLPKYKFKRLLYRQLLSILMQEDTYVDVHT